MGGEETRPARLGTHPGCQRRTEQGRFPHWVFTIE